jgi:predicted RNA-binding Zn-ribbon protein involved in translation (DUF1610 family)
LSILRSRKAAPTDGEFAMAVMCPTCGEALETDEEMDAHDHEIPLALRHGGAGFNCPICGAEFDSAEGLVEHEAIHVRGQEPDTA